MHYDLEDREFLEYLGSFGIVSKNASMDLFTTFACGGKADILLIPRNDREGLSSLIKVLSQTSIPVSIIGGGSNLLVGDKGIRGIVISFREIANIRGRISLEEGSIVYADAIVQKNRFVKKCISLGLGRIEFMAGIPGCIGGGIAMNAGTDGGNFSDILKSIVYIKPNGEISETDVINAGYRDFSIEEGAVVCGAYFRLLADDSNKIKKNVDEIISARVLKHPLEYPSAGSVFKNPKEEAAWKLINDAGLRGKHIGGAMVSEKHTNFIVNRENAKAADVKELIELIQDTIMNKFSIKIETELKLIGEF